MIKCVDFLLRPSIRGREGEENYVHMLFIHTTLQRKCRQVQLVYGKILSKYGYLSGSGKLQVRLTY